MFIEIVLLSILLNMISIIYWHFTEFLILFFLVYKLIFVSCATW